MSTEQHAEARRDADVSRPAQRASLRQRLEFSLVWLLVRSLGALPRSVARFVGAALGAICFRVLARLGWVGRRNLTLAYPDWSRARREQTLRAVYRSLGWQLAEFCQMAGYTLSRASQIVEYSGLEHYVSARSRNKGVLVLTGHLGAWELSSFYHSLAGYPMGLVIRRLDNPLVDAFVNRIRCLHGNRVIHKDDFARGLISSMRAGETVGILMDTNMTPPQGVFVPFFGVQACTAAGVARVALKTEAAVLPGFLLWNQSGRRYVLHFGECIELIRTGAAEHDILANTAKFTSAIEHAIRSAPEQWLWLHRRWKTRPPGQPPVYET